MSSQCPDTGIQESLLVGKQTSTESGYNIFDEIAERLDSSAQTLVSIQKGVIPVPRHWDPGKFACGQAN
ncbi:hypothetical protein [Wolbachia pipientis]|uniref:hypothetical protein n=1 Tax=Wolbachia pipientis TaxID=955 RepID=UPI0038B4A9AE